jgi:hypothetical protein
MIPIALFGRFETEPAAGPTLHRRYGQQASAYADAKSCDFSSFRIEFRPSTVRRYLTTV